MSSTNGATGLEKYSETHRHRGARFHRQVRATPQPCPLDPVYPHRPKTRPQNDRTKTFKHAQPTSLPHYLRILYTLGLIANYFLQRAPALTEEAGRA